MTPKEEKPGDQARELELTVERNRDVFLVLNGDLFKAVEQNIEDLNSSEQIEKQGLRNIFTRLVGNLIKFFCS